MSGEAFNWTRWAAPLLSFLNKSACNPDWERQTSNFSQSALLCSYDTELPLSPSVEKVLIETDWLHLSFSFLNKSACNPDWEWSTSPLSQSSLLFSLLLSSYNIIRNCLRTILCEYSLQSKPADFSFYSHRIAKFPCILWHTSTSIKHIFDLRTNKNFPHIYCLAAIFGPITYFFWPSISCSHCSNHLSFLFS